MSESKVLLQRSLSMASGPACFRPLLCWRLKDIVFLSAVQLPQKCNFLQARSGELQILQMMDFLPAMETLAATSAELRSSAEVFSPFAFEESQNQQLLVDANDWHFPVQTQISS